MRGGSFRSIEFPALVGLLHHPSRGYMLYDTGYSKRFWNATRSFPECLYRKITPATLPAEEELIYQLETRNIKPEDIGTIIISHFHADHVAGLKDFPKAKFISMRGEYEEMMDKGRFARLRGAFLRDLLPEDFTARVTYAEGMPVLDTPLHGFPEAYDLFGDGSLLGVSLPGHARMQLGVLFQNSTQQSVFLIGDASWKLEALEKRKLPSRITKLLFADSKEYAKTFFKLADLLHEESSLVMIPSHCTTAWKRYGNTMNLVHG